MRRRIAIATATAGIAAAIVTPVVAFAGSAAPVADPSLCVTAHVDINGTVQDLNQCLPPA
jgi:hypothetical protein